MAAFWRALFNLFGCFSVSGKFREKASILHKIAKKKCQVEDSEKANGVASRSGKKKKKWIKNKKKTLVIKDQKKAKPTLDENLNSLKYNAHHISKETTATAVMRGRKPLKTQRWKNKQQLASYKRIEI